ncbi:HlyD family secretion protein [Nitrosomonas sp. PY1]|uniref:HlyD family secretion protein n=1 Tax=Nitrosomonas sp. PY1 TaxID=1803906 RepID=UPI001FC8E6EB|nr:HlyD family efflux transporter periplasmic adaptor subunit [Nitrosomonas sp. PY1]
MSPDHDRGLLVQYSHAKRLGKSWRWYLIVLVVSLPLLYLLGLIIWDGVAIEANGRIRVTNFVMRAPVDGHVQQIWVQPLQRVMEGEPLAQLANTLLQEQHDRVQMEVASLAREKQKLLDHAGQSQSASLQLLKFSQERKDFLHKRLRQYESLFQQGAATQAEVATIHSQYQAALENSVLLQKAQHSAQNLAPEMIQISNHMNQRMLEFENIRNQVAQLELIAPITGMVTEIFVQPEEYLGKGQPLMEIIIPDTIYIDAFIPPKHQNYAVIGQVAQVKFPNGEIAKAKVVAVPGIVQKSTSDESGPLETVRSAVLARMEFIDQVNNRLMNGMPVEVYFRGIMGEY